MKNPIQIENNHCCKDSGFSINFLKWFTWGYGIISSILLIFLNLNGIFDYMDNPNSAINMWLTGGMSLLTLAFLFFLFESLFKRKRKALSISLSLILVVISNLVFWLAVPSCIDAAELFFLEHRADYECYTIRPFQDHYNRILFFCFFPYVFAAFVWFVSLVHKRFLFCQDALNNKRQMVAYCMMYPILYLVFVFSASPVACVLALVLIPLQLLSLVWRDCKKMYLTLNILCYLNVAVLLILDKIVGSWGYATGAGPVNMWYSVFMMQFAVLFLAYPSVTIFTVKKSVRNKLKNKNIQNI